MGPIDEFFDFSLGALEYKTTRFEHREIAVDNYQGVAIMNYTDAEVPYTRIIEHKHFHFSDTPSTWVTWEFPEAYVAGTTEAYYPVNDVDNMKLLSSYKDLASQYPNIEFRGRLGEYKYYDMHQVIESALEFVAAVSD